MLTIVLCTASVLAIVVPTVYSPCAQGTFMQSLIRGWMELMHTSTTYIASRGDCVLLPSVRTTYLRLPYTLIKTFC